MKMVGAESDPRAGARGRTFSFHVLFPDYGEHSTCFPSLAPVLVFLILLESFVVFSTISRASATICHCSITHWRISTAPTRSRSRSSSLVNLNHLNDCTEFHKTPARTYGLVIVRTTSTHNSCNAVSHAKTPTLSLPDLTLTRQPHRTAPF